MIRTDADGRYRFRSKVRSATACPGGSTDKLLTLLGRHGTRPAYIHFFVTVSGHRKLTTQINIDGGPYLWDDLTFATREGLVPPMKNVDDPAALRAHEVDAPYYAIDFDFDFDFDRHAARSGLPADQIERAHFEA